MNLNRIVCFVCLIALLSACTPEEGKGGLASIQGVIMTQNINSLFEKSGEAFPATDEDVFISYGNSGIADDKTSTGSNGKFMFANLTKGDYTLSVYSDDTTSNAKNPKVCFTRAISLDNKKTEASVDTFVIYKHVDFDEGNGSVRGNVQEVYNSGSIVLDTINNVDADVYLQFQNGDEIIDMFPPIIEGNNVFLDLTEPYPDFYNQYNTYYVWLSDSHAYYSDGIQVTNNGLHDGFIINFGNVATTKMVANFCVRNLSGVY